MGSQVRILRRRFNSQFSLESREAICLLFEKKLEQQE